MSEWVYGLHLLIGSVLVGFDYAYYSRAREDIDEMFVINRVIFILLWEITVAIVAYQLATGKNKVGDFRA